jgi:hypothetical protein
MLGWKPTELSSLNYRRGVPLGGGTFGVILPPELWRSPALDADDGHG